MFALYLVKNLFDYLNMYKKEEPVNENITSTTSSINETKFIPSKLSIEDVCEWAKKYFDDLPEDELKKLFEKFNSEKVDGKTLLKASVNNKYLKDLKKRLGLTEKRDIECFDKMVDFVRQKQKELNKNLAEQSEENIAGPSKDSEDTTKDTRKIGVQLHKDKFSTTSLGDINVDLIGSAKEGNVGLYYKGTDYADLTAKDINVKVDTTKSVPKKRPARRYKSKIKRKKFH